jgi:hypothetical protein
MSLLSVWATIIWFVCVSHFLFYYYVLTFLKFNAVFHAQVANMTLWMAQIGGASWTSLQQFSLGSNQLSGNIPATLGQTWTQLQIFQLNNNLFTGSIPPTLGANWGSSILTFSLAQNQFSGSLAAQFGSTWPNIQTISLNNNLLSGTSYSDVFVSDFSSCDLFWGVINRFDSIWPDMAQFAIACPQL